MHRTCSLRSPYKFRFALVLLALTFWPGSVEAQVSKPPKRSKDDHHQASARQHKLLDPMETVWAQCLSPHLASCTTQDIRVRISSTLQNQYSEHAAYNFREELVAILAQDLGIGGIALKNGGLKLLAGGPGVKSALVDELMQKAVNSSGGKLAFEGIWGQPGSLASQHNQVITRRRGAKYPGSIRELDFADITSDQKRGLKELARHYEGCFKATLPIEGNPKRKRLFRVMLEDSLLRLSADHAVDGIRSKLIYAIEHSVGYTDKNPSAQTCIEQRQTREAYIEEHVTGAFWKQLRDYHKRLLKNPSEARKKLKQKGCVICRPQ